MPRRRRMHLPGSPSTFGGTVAGSYFGLTAASQVGLGTGTQGFSIQRSQAGLERPVREPLRPGRHASTPPHSRPRRANRVSRRHSRAMSSCPSRCTRAPSCTAAAQTTSPTGGTSQSTSSGGTGTPGTRGLRHPRGSSGSGRHDGYRVQSRQLLPGSHRPVTVRPAVRPGSGGDARQLRGRRQRRQRGQERQRGQPRAATAPPARAARALARPTIARKPTTNHSTVAAVDPNSKIGPSGYTESGVTFISGSALTLFPYRINFENSPTATAPAQQVVITDQLDPSLDLSTFQLIGNRLRRC